MAVERCDQNRPTPLPERKPASKKFGVAGMIVKIEHVKLLCLTSFPPLLVLLLLLLLSLVFLNVFRMFRMKAKCNGLSYLADIH